MIRARDLLTFAVRSLSICAVAAGCFFGFSPSVSAAASSDLLYQAHLRTSSGAMAPDGVYLAKFSLYTASSGGTRLWTAAGTVGTPTTVSVTVVNGAFSIALGDAGSQNTLSGVDWNQSIYLGITIGSDSEMTPRRALTAVPSAFLSNNALQLQGMSASSTAYGSDSLFTIHQTETSAATGTRTALEVRSEGTSDANDYLFRAVNDLGNGVFSINRQGNVTSTGNIYSAGGVYVGSTATFYGENNLTATGAYTASSILALNLRGKNGASYITLDSDALISGSAGIVLDSGTGAILPSADLASSLGNVSARFNAYLGSVTSTNAQLTYVTSTAISSGSVSSTNVTVDYALSAGSVSATSVYSSGRLVAGFDTIGGLTAGLSYTATFSGIKKTQVVGNRLYVQNTSGIDIFDVSDPTSERHIGQVAIAGSTPRSFEVEGGIIYVVYLSAGLTTRIGAYDVTDAGAPLLFGDNLVSGAATVGFSVDVYNQAAYVISSPDSSLTVLDVRDPRQPIPTQVVALGNDPKDLLVEGNRLYVVLEVGTATGLLNVYDISDPLAPVLRSQTAIGAGYTWKLLANRDIIYAFHDGASQGARIIDASTSTAPIVLQDFDLGYRADAAMMLGGRMVVGSANGALALYNVSSSTAPTALGSVVVNGAASISSIASVGEYLFLGQDAMPYIRNYRMPGLQVDTFSAGRGSIFSLDVQGSLKVMDHLQIDGSATIGAGGLSSIGAIGSSINSTTSTAGYFVNRGLPSTGQAWGLYTNRLLVGDNQYATGSLSYAAVFTHDSGQSRFGVCIDDSATASTCLNFADTSTIYSLMADDAIGANAFDLAERYAITGEAGFGDVLVLDEEHPMHMKKSSGIPYDTHLSGVVSTRPGFVLGTGGNVSVALVGRVPVKVTVSNGSIQPGDPVTSSDLPGIAMKATQAGRILGRALEGTTTDGQIEVFLQPGFDASALLQADGSMTMIAQDTGLQAQAQASALAPAQSSRALSFRGSVWNGAQPSVSEFRLFNQVESVTNSALSITYGAASSSIFALSQTGSLTLMGDLALAGKLYPSARGTTQNNSYIFVDDTQPDTNYISTNADGWQAEDSYDYAERYQSPDKLEPGDLVVVRRSDRLYVQRSLNTNDMLVGIVSTKPGFIAGRPQKDSYPIALAGRVPTKVSTMNGAIEPGDPLAPSTIPGVAVKATRSGPIVGLALDSYAGSDVGKIEVFVNPTWWGGTGTGSDTEGVDSSGKALQKSQGFAEIVAGKTKVHVTLSGFIRYPLLQVTPYAQMEKGWWIDRVSSAGFDLVLGGSIGRNARFSWSAAETPTDLRVSLSSGRVFDIDPISGEIQFPPGVSDEDPPTATPARAPEPEVIVAEPEPVVEEAPVTEPPVPEVAPADAPSPVAEEVVEQSEPQPQPEPEPKSEPVILETPAVELSTDVPTVVLPEAVPDAPAEQIP